MFYIKEFGSTDEREFRFSGKSSKFIEIVAKTENRAPDLRFGEWESKKKEIELNVQIK